MKKLMKFASMVMVGLFALIPMMNVDAKTLFTATDWETDNNTYGSFTKVDDNITNLKGNAIDTNGQFFGPFTHKSTAALADGITEEVNVELDPETWAQAEYITLTTSLKNQAGEYVSEAGIWAQKDGDAIYIFPSWNQTDRTIKITEKGVYTFQYNFTMDKDKVNFNFNLKLWDDVVASINEDLDNIVGPDTKNPVAEQEGVVVKSIWFNNITVANGVNVYTNLPENPSEEIPVEPVNPVDPETPVEEVKDEVANPETSDGILLFLGLTAVGIAGSVLTYRRLHN